MRYLRLFIFLLLSMLCVYPLSAQSGKSIDANTHISTIAFGSCNRQDLPQDMWQHILANDPELWVWLGDNIYGDTDDKVKMVAKYNRQLGHPEYQELLASCKVIGTWDDHDFGINDGGTEFEFKYTAQDLMLDFLGEPEGSKRRKTPGVYSSYTWGEEDKQLKVIMLDGRFFREKQEKSGGKNQRYTQNTTGTFLGKKQWKWLKRELRKSEATINLIGLGVQVIPEEHPFEKLANFPNERKRMLDIIAKSKAKNVIFLSGDRHIAEFSKMKYPGIPYPLYDFTSSGLTHSYEKVGKEPNRHRISKLIGQRNFGLIEIDWAQKRLKASIRGLENVVYDEIEIQF